MKNQLTTQLREFYLSQTEDYNPGKQILRKLGEMFYLLEAEGFTYIFETKYHTSKWRTDILHKVHQGYTVQGNTYKVEQQVTMTPYGAEKEHCSFKKFKSSLWLEALWLMHNTGTHCTLGREEAQTNTETEFSV